MAEHMTGGAGQDPRLGPGGNGLTREVFLRHVKAVTDQKAKVKAEQQKLNTIRTTAKAEGVVLGALDLVVKMADWNREEVRDQFTTQLQYAGYLNLPGIPEGGSLDLFNVNEDVPEEERGPAEWFAIGKTAGLLGREAVPPDTCPPERVQDWLAGRDEGQKELAMALGKKPK